MAVISDVELAVIIAEAGFSGKGAHNAFAYALAETGGHLDPRISNAEGNTPAGSIDRGLWMINNYWHREIPDFVAYNPRLAAVAVRRISADGTDWSQWVAVPDDADYQRAAAAFKAAGDKLPKGGNWATGPVGDAIGVVVDPIVTVAEMVKALYDAVAALTRGETWVRIAEVVAGLVLVFFSIRYIARET